MENLILDPGFRISVLPAAFLNMLGNMSNVEPCLWSCCASRPGLKTRLLNNTARRFITLFTAASWEHISYTPYISRCRSSKHENRSTGTVDRCFPRCYSLYAEFFGDNKFEALTQSVMFYAVYSNPYNAVGIFHGNPAKMHRGVMF